MTSDTAVPGTPRVLRGMNDRAALELLLAEGPMSRGQIGARTGLSKPTASQLLARLTSAGLVAPVGTTDGGPGPRAQLYQLVPTAGHAAAIEVSPRGLDCRVADLTGAVVGRHHVPTAGRRASGTVQKVRAALAGACADAGVRGVDHLTISTPGTFDESTETLRYARHLAGWHAPRLMTGIREAVGVPVDFENDVNLAAIAEQRVGGARGVPDFVLFWIGTDGIGSAIVLDGRLRRGATGGAGEVGYLPLPGAEVHKLTRGENGGFTELAGNAAILRLAREYRIGGRSAADALRIAARAAEQDAGCAGARLLEALAHRIALGLSAIIAVLDPELILLSGEVLLAGGEPLARAVRGELRLLAITIPRLLTGSVRDRPVLTGALHNSLAHAREKAFTTT